MHIWGMLMGVPFFKFQIMVTLTNFTFGLFRFNFPNL